MAKRVTIVLADDVIEICKKLSEKYGGNKVSALSNCARTVNAILKALDDEDVENVIISKSDETEYLEIKPVQIVK